MTTNNNHVHELANQANELTEDELEHVSGGRGTPKLLEAAIKGQVFKKVEIHGTA
jgi:bacteriocin-like protein